MAAVADVLHDRELLFFPLEAKVGSMRFQVLPSK
jgi:hypothetical protein